MTLFQFNVGLVVCLALVGYGALAYYVGKQDGRREVHDGYGAARRREIEEAKEREEKYRELLREVQALQAMHATGRRAGSA